MRMTILQLLLFPMLVRERAAVYHLHDPELLPIGVALRYLVGARIVYDVHEDYCSTIMVKYWIPPRLRRLAATVFSRLELFLARRVSAIVTATGGLVTRYKKICPLVVAVRNLPLSLWFQDVSTSASMRRSSELRLVYTGGLSLLRGSEVILETVKLLSQMGLQVRCHIVGTIEVSLAHSHFKDLFGELVGTRALVIHGELPHREVLRIISECDIGWVPEDAYQDALLVKIFEYMGCGKPVVTTYFPETCQLIRHHDCALIVNDNTAEAHAAAILWLAHHPEAAAGMGCRGRQAVASLLNWERESSLLLGLYERLSAPSGKPGRAF